MRAVLIILLTVSLLGCSKDEIFDPTGLYNVTTQEGSQTRIGAMTINKDDVNYKIFFDQSAGGYGTIRAIIINGNITINTKVGNSTYLGSGRVGEDGTVSMDFSIKSFGITHKLKVQGNRAK